MRSYLVIALVALFHGARQRKKSGETAENFFSDDFRPLKLWTARKTGWRLRN